MRRTTEPARERDRESRGFGFVGHVKCVKASSPSWPCFFFFVFSLYSWGIEYRGRKEERALPT